LPNDSLSKFCKKKFADILNFQAFPSSYSLISTNKTGQVFLEELYYFFEENSQQDSVTPQLPANFTKILNKLKLQYGEPTSGVETGDKNPLIVKELGLFRVCIWECNNTILQLRVNYGSNKKELNVLDIQLRRESISQAKVLQ
ncbi:MAG: hypothetical protein ABJA37_11855, partial [Ferruginibacter sp.]